MQASLGHCHTLRLDRYHSRDASRIALYATDTSVSLQERAEALWHHRSRFGLSLSARTKRPARSDSVCEHRDSRADGARVMVTFSASCRWQQAKHAGGRHAAEAARHRAQRARIDWDAQAHLAAHLVHLGLAVADAAEQRELVRTAAEIMSTEVRITTSKVSDPLPTSTKARACTRHTLSVVVGPVSVQRAMRQK